MEEKKNKPNQKDEGQASWERWGETKLERWWIKLILNLMKNKMLQEKTKCKRWSIKLILKMKNIQNVKIRNKPNGKHEGQT